MPAPAIPGLSGSWQFNEGECEPVYDYSGNNNRASFTNVAWSAGRIDVGALWFNGGTIDNGGSRAWVSNDNYRVLPAPGSPFTVSMWFNTDGISNGWQGLIGNAANGSNGWSVALHNSGPGTNEFIFASSGPSPLNVTGRKLIFPVQWYDLTVTYDGAEGAVYLDGELLGRGTGAVFSNEQPIFIGGGIAGFDSFRGRIDEVRTYTNSLSREEISVTGRWNFDENSGSLIADSSIQRHHATASDSTSWVPGRNGSGINLETATIAISNSFFEVLPPTGRPFSISFWIKPAILPTDRAGVMSCADGTNSGWNLAIGPGDAGLTMLRFWSTDSSGTLDLSSPVTLTEAAWNKIDLTFNGGIANLYLNGLKVHSDNGGIRGSTAPLIVGSVPGITNFNGVIDELKIYRRERTESEIGPVAKVMWETVFMNSATNLQLQGFGPTGKPLTYSIVGTVSPTNGTVSVDPNSGIATYVAGAAKGPDAFAYAVSDGEFTSPSTIVAMSVVEPHWLSPNGGPTQPSDGRSPAQAWLAGPSDALDAIWKTNNYYDAFFYAPGEYQTTGWRFQGRSTSNPGCKHIGSASEGPHQTTVKLVNTWEAWSEGMIFGSDGDVACDGFEVHHMFLDCNAANNPKYAVGEPIWIVIPLVTTSHVDTVTLRWDSTQLYGNGLWRFGPAREFSLCTRAVGTNGYVTNWTSVMSTGQVDIVSVNAETDQILLQLNRRAAGADFYSLSEIEVKGASISLPSATVVGSGESQLNTNNAEYSILHIVDGNEGTVWASGPEDQVQISIPLDAGTQVSEIDFSWNCHVLPGGGQLGPAADYDIFARDPESGEFFDVSFTRLQRSAMGMESNLLSNPLITDQIRIVLKGREQGVDYYSLKEVRLLNGWAAVSPKLPGALNFLSWDKDYHILRAFDGDGDTQWASGTQDMIGAISAGGNNLKFTHVKVVGFGTKAARECFVMVVRPPQYDVRARFGNVLVEDCIFTEPASENRDGLTTVSVFGLPGRPLTNAIVQRCSVTGVKPYFAYSVAFTSIDVENCFVTDCQVAVYFEPARAWGDNLGPVLVRSNSFLNVAKGVFLYSHPAAQFDSLTILDNEIVLTGSSGSGFGVCDTCDPGPSGSITNVTVLNNIVRYSDWSPNPWAIDIGLHATDIRNAVFGNNIIALGTSSSLRVRQCPAGFIPPVESETCDSVILPPPPPTHPPCLDPLPTGYRRAWFGNRDLSGQLLKVKYYSNFLDGLASQQQWP